MVKIDQIICLQAGNCIVHKLCLNEFEPPHPRMEYSLKAKKCIDRYRYGSVYIYIYIYTHTHTHKHREL